MNKRGFTLIELLAVIIILAILMIIAVPNVLRTLREAKIKAFKTELQSIWKAAEKQYITDYMNGGQGRDCYDKRTLDLSSASDDLSFMVLMDEVTGKANSIVGVKIKEKMEGEGNNVDTITVTFKDGLSEVTCSNAPDYLDGTIASAPELGDLVPIKYDGSTWVYADKTKKWYDYANKEWANAVVLTESAKATKKVNDEITESDIEMWFVWVPRYEYKLPSNVLRPMNATGIGDKVTPLDIVTIEEDNYVINKLTTGPASVDPYAFYINFIPASQTEASEYYNLHPGFKFGSTWKSGIWVGKFETGAAITSGEQANSVQVPVIKPNVSSWRNVNLFNMYQSSMLLDSSYGMTRMDSHLTRYTEWTTMSYLSNSIYGRCSDEYTCTEIGQNAISGKTDYEDNTSYVTGAGNYRSNVNQSSTGNITGIYDINGGSTEAVMGYIKDASDLTLYDGFTSSNLPTDPKYTDIFVSSYPDANNYNYITHVNGTENFSGTFVELYKYNKLFNDSLFCANSEYPWFYLGGDWDMGNYAGAFYSADYDGVADVYIGFRIALIVK